MSAVSTTTVTLSNGNQMPILGLGTWKSSPGQVKQAVIDAIEAGYRHIDCARAYQNENEVGEALKAKIDEGTIKREDVFITSKLWNTFHRSDLVEGTLRDSLQALGLDYLDLYLVHWPMAYKEGGELFPKDESGKFLYSDVDFLDTWKALEECAKKGLVKSLGVSNFNSQQLQRVIDNSAIKPVVNQVECHPYLNQKKLIQFCKDHGVVVTAYSPLGSPDRPWAKPDDPSLLEDPKLKSIAEKYNKSVAQVLIRYQIERGVVVIPKSVTKSRIIDNARVFDFQLSPEDLQLIDTLDCNGRFCHLDWVKDHPHFPFGIEF